MSNVAIAGPNLQDQSKGSFVVHSADCADLKKMARKDPMFQKKNLMTMEATSLVEIAQVVYADIIAEHNGEDVDIATYTSEFHVCDCVPFAEKASGPARVNKKQNQVAAMIDAMRKTHEAMPFSMLCDQVEQRYPQDVVAAFHALEHVGLVERGKDGNAVTYKWVGAK